MGSYRYRSLIEGLLYLNYRSLIEALHTLNSPPVVSFKKEPRHDVPCINPKSTQP